MGGRGAAAGKAAAGKAAADTARARTRAREDAGDRSARYARARQVWQTHLHGSDEYGGELLVVLVRLCGSDVDELPLNVVGYGCEALEGDLELEGVCKGRRVV